MNPRHAYLVVTEKFLPRKGGASIFLSEVFGRLGDRSTVIVTNDQPGAAAFDATHPNTVVRVALLRYEWLRPESLFMYLKLTGACLRQSLGRRFRAVHAARALPEGLVGWVVARLTGRPIVCWCHGEELTIWRQPGKFRAMLFTFHRADCILANSDYTEQELVKLGVPRERIRVVYPGVDLERFRPGLPCDDLKQAIGLAPGQKLVLGVGRLTRRKGFDQLIRALPRLRDRGLDARLALIGIGADQEYLPALAREAGVADRVHLLGHVPEQDLPRWYNAADVFAMPNREDRGDTEGFGLVYLEANACGKPALAGTAGGTAASVEEGVSGLRVDGESLEAVADGLYRLLADPAYGARLGHQGYRRVHARFSWDRVAAEVEATVS